MKLNKICLLFSLCLLMLFGCKKSFNEKGVSSEMKFGKELTIVISENEIIDSKYLEQVLNGKIKRDSPFFDLWDAQEFEKMIDYMEENNLSLIPGEYTFNQTWKFDNGFLVLNNNEKRKVFKFGKNN